MTGWMCIFLVRDGPFSLAMLNFRWDEDVSFPTVLNLRWHVSNENNAPATTPVAMQTPTKLWRCSGYYQSSMIFRCAYDIIISFKFQVSSQFSGSNKRPWCFFWGGKGSGTIQRQRMSRAKGQMAQEVA